MQPAPPSLSGFFPDEPEVPEEQRASGASTLRYEDVDQNGRLVVVAVPNVIGASVWPRVAAHPGCRALLEAGVMPILTRFVIDTREADGSIAVHRPLAVEGRFALAHGVGSDGNVSQIHLNMWATARAPEGRTYDVGAAREATGRRTITAARLFAEHTFTRLFAPPEQRRVTRLDAPGLPSVPEPRWPNRSTAELLALPDGAVALDEAAVTDALPLAFGLDHTDANRHVNSLVYQKAFIEAALRRLAARGESTALLARRLEISYRKPSFAGDRLRVTVRAFRLADGTLGAAGTFVSDGHDDGGEPDARPRVVAQVWFSR